MIASKKIACITIKKISSVRLMISEQRAFVVNSWPVWVIDTSIQQISTQSRDLYDTEYFSHSDQISNSGTRDLNPYLFCLHLLRIILEWFVHTCVCVCMYVWSLLRRSFVPGAMTDDNEVEIVPCRRVRNLFAVRASIIPGSSLCIRPGNNRMSLSLLPWLKNVSDCN